MIEQINNAFPLIEKLLSLGFTVILAIGFIGLVVWYLWQLRPKVESTSDAITKHTQLMEIALKTLDKLTEVQDKVSDDIIAHKQQTAVVMQMVSQKIERFEELAEDIMKNRITNDTIQRMHSRIDETATKEDIQELQRQINDLFREICRGQK